MPRLKLILEYDGTDYVGWQMQANGPSVQAVVEAALEKLLGTHVPTVAAGRTDSGVHALGQVVVFDSPRDLPLKAFHVGLNGMLPPDICVRSAAFVEPGFDPRRDARAKRYRYLVSNRRGRAPLRRRTHWELFTPLDLDAMIGASRALLGRHDFSSFQAADCEAAHPIREVLELTLTRPQEEGGEVLRFEVVGTAFLKHMVRNVVGSLVEVGKGRRPVSWIAETLAARDRTRAGPTAPARGLILVEVLY